MWLDSWVSSVCLMMKCCSFKTSQGNPVGFAFVCLCLFPSVCSLPPHPADIILSTMVVLANSSAFARSILGCDAQCCSHFVWLSIVGALGFWPLTIFFPIEMYIVQKRIKRFSGMWIWLQSVSLVCLCVSLAAAIGSIAQLRIDTSSGFTPFSTVY